jgi:hypothetical protein
LTIGTLSMVAGSWSSSATLTCGKGIVGWAVSEAAGEAGWDPDAAAEDEAPAEAVADEVAGGLPDGGAGDALAELQPASRVAAMTTPSNATAGLREKRIIDHPDR